MRKRPLWIITAPTDGRVVRADGDSIVGEVWTVIRMPVGRWREATAHLPDGAVVEARKRGPFWRKDFVFRGPLPPGTTISFGARRPVHFVREQWFERD